MHLRLFLLSWLVFFVPVSALFELRTVTATHIERFLRDNQLGTATDTCGVWVDSFPDVSAFFVHGNSHRLMQLISNGCLPFVTTYQSDIDYKRQDYKQFADSLVRIPGFQLFCKPQKCLRYGVTDEFKAPESGWYSIDVRGEAVTWLFLNGKRLSNPFDTLVDWEGSVVGTTEILPEDSGRGYRIDELYLDSGMHLFEYYRLGIDSLMSDFVVRWKTPSMSEYQIIPGPSFSEHPSPVPPEVEIDSCWVGAGEVEKDMFEVGVLSDTAITLKARVINSTSRLGECEFLWDMGDDTTYRTKDPFVTHVYQNLSDCSDSAVRPILGIVYDSLFYNFTYSPWSFRKRRYHPPYYPPEENDPELVIIPFGGDTIQERMVRFEWHKHSGCDSYLVHASRDIIWDSHDQHRYTVYNTGALQVSIQPGKYYWRACCGTNESGCSSVDSFFVAGSLNASRNSTLDPEKYLTVRFLHTGSLHYVALPERRPPLVEFKIYSINGSLLYSDQHSGSKLFHTIDIYDNPTRRMIPGVYLLQVKAGSFSRFVRIGLE